MGKDLGEFFNEEKYHYDQKMFKGTGDDLITKISDYIKQNPGAKFKVKIELREDILIKDVKQHIAKLYPNDKYHSFSFKEVRDIVSDADWLDFVKTFDFYDDLDDLLNGHDGWDVTNLIPETLLNKWCIMK